MPVIYRPGRNIVDDDADVLVKHRQRGRRDGEGGGASLQNEMAWNRGAVPSRLPARVVEGGRMRSLPVAEMWGSILGRARH